MPIAKPVRVRSSSAAATVLESPKSVRNACSEPFSRATRMFAGLDVAVDEAVAVRLVERARDLRDDADRPLGLERRLGLEDVAQVGALDVAHRHVEQPVLLAGLEDLDGVRVVDRRRQAALALEAGAEDVVLGHAGRDQLERDAAAEREVGRLVDDGHAAAARQRVDAMAGERRSRSEL